MQSTQYQSYLRIWCVFQGQVIFQCRSYLCFKFDNVLLTDSVLTSAEKWGYLGWIHFVEFGCDEKKSGCQNLMIFFSEGNAGRQTVQIRNSKVLSIPCYFFCVWHDPLYSRSSLAIVRGIDGARGRRGSLGEAGQRGRLVKCLQRTAMRRLVEFQLHFLLINSNIEGSDTVTAKDDQKPLRMVLKRGTPKERNYYCRRFMDLFKKSFLDHWYQVEWIILWNIYFSMFCKEHINIKIKFWNYLLNYDNFSIIIDKVSPFLHYFLFSIFLNNFKVELEPSQLMAKVSQKR